MERAPEATLMRAGGLSRMAITADASGNAHYHLRIGEHSEPLNAWLGHNIALQFAGSIHCVHCQRLTRKSFGQGHCYACFRRLARCDTCMMAPERCHYFQGTCREPEWGERHCFAPHVVYLASSSGAKVGITKPSQMPTRWLDQGAVQALPILSVASRRQSGMVEALFRSEISDRTHWQRMLKGETSDVDLIELRDELMTRLAPGLAALRAEFGEDNIQAHAEQRVARFDYPVLAWPTRVSAFNLDRTAKVEGRLMGLKGQYLILDSGVINLRKYAGYQVSVTLSAHS
ncbi:hypothetical protein GCM10010082_06850 [Kushneria pakistanensis]|uniref:DUF2797 domain-containing protein n=2 Tax=Kushneria pakistanensis TaxID=1508770 RepID=A0ABQ3FCB3_9GAMM|nr:hypothetical protein GCM10010082_06850 [Kushneria pakistanensis]